MTKVTWWLGWTGWLEWLGWHGWLYHYNNYSCLFLVKNMLCYWSIIGLCSTWLYRLTCLKSQKFFAFSVEPSVSQLSPWWQVFITYVYYVLCIDQNNWLVSFCSFCRVQRSYLWPWSKFDLTVDGSNCRFFIFTDMKLTSHAIVWQTWNNIIQCSGKIAEGNDCGWITALRLEIFAFLPMFVATEHWVMF